MTFNDLTKFIKLCKRHGVASATWGEMSITFGDKVTGKRVSTKKEEPKLTEEQIQYNKEAELDRLMIEDPMAFENEIKKMR